MHAQRLKAVIVALLWFPVASLYAAGEVPKQDDSFNKTCVNMWMKRGQGVNDQVAFQNFGEKYCECAATQPLDSDASVEKAAETCMVRVLLHDAMDIQQNKYGVSKVTAEGIQASCAAEWMLIFPKMDAAEKTSATAYCNCAQPQLFSLVKIHDTLTDQQYVDKINEIAQQCTKVLDDADAAKQKNANTLQQPPADSTKKPTPVTGDIDITTPKVPVGSVE